MGLKAKLSVAKVIELLAASGLASPVSFGERAKCVQLSSLRKHDLIF